jgi:hypothetical protein
LDVEATGHRHDSPYEAQYPSDFRFQTKPLEYSAKPLRESFHIQVAMDNCRITQGILDEDDVGTLSLVRREKALMIGLPFGEVEGLETSFAEKLL